MTVNEVSAEERYAQLTAVLGGIWDALSHVTDPEWRAGLAERAAAASRELRSLAPDVFGAADLAVYGDAVVWDHYAATERAIAGELELPAELDGSLVGQHPDVLLLWVELAASEHRDQRARVLLQLADTIGGTTGGGDAACTLARLAETEQALADDAARATPHTAGDTAADDAPTFTAFTTGPLTEATRAADADRGQDRRLGWSWSMLTPRQIGGTSGALAGAALLPPLYGWPARDVVVVALVALAVEIYTVLPIVRPPSSLAWLLALLTWPFSR